MTPSRLENAIVLPDLYRKYGLSIGVAFKQRDLAIKNHWLVCRYLEEHSEVAAKWRSPGFMYYDILDAAEQLYLGLPPYSER